MTDTDSIGQTISTLWYSTHAKLNTYIQNITTDRHNTIVVHG